MRFCEIKQLKAELTTNRKKSSSDDYFSCGVLGDS